MALTKKTLQRILLVALCLLIAVYLLYHIINELSKDAELFAVRPYTATDVQTFSGYIFREETPLYTSAVGARNYSRSDGEKVAVGGEIAMVYRSGDEATTKSLADLRQKAEILRAAEKLGDIDADTLDKEITLLYSRIALSTSKDASDNLSNQLLVLLAKKELMATDKANYTAEIAELDYQRAVLASALGAVAERITAPVSGIFYSNYDGLSSLFTGETARTLTPEIFDMLVGHAQEQAPIINAIGFLMNNFTWYYACRTTSSSAEGFAVGSIYECTFPDNRYTKPIKMTLYGKQADSDGSLLIFTATTVPGDFDMTRCQRMTAVRTTYTGLRIPAETVRVVDNRTCVYIFKEGAARLRAVDILFEQDGYFIVAETISDSDIVPLRLNDVILVGEKELYDGKVIE